jgi:hypothetical protein
MPRLAENRESWETLQKGQIAELAFERIALANGYAVQYTGRQYTELVEPSSYRQKQVNADSWRPDFQLKKRVEDGWVDHAVVEVKWRSVKASSPSKVSSQTQYLVLFTPEGVFAASVTEGKVGSLEALSKCVDLGLSDARCSDIVKATQQLIAAFGNPPRS